MKIAVLSSFPPKKCGIAYLTENLFDELRAQGHDLITFGVDESACDHPIDTKSMFGLFKTVSQIRKQNIEYVSVQFIIGFFRKRYFGLNLLLFLIALRKHRVIVTLHEIHYLRSFRHLVQDPSTVFHIVLEGLISRLSSGVIVHTEYQAACLRKYGVRNVRCIYLGIRLYPILRERKTFNHALFFGKLSPAKGIHLLPGIAKVCPEIHFTVACSSQPQYKEYQVQMIQGFAEIKNAEFICKEWIGDEEKESYFAAADVLVLPYLDGYYQSGAASESGVYNIPVIVPRLGPLTEIVDKYHSGECVPFPSPHEIKSAIYRIFQNYPSYLAGIERYRNEANWTIAARKYCEFLIG